MTIWLTALLASAIIGVTELAKMNRKHPRERAINFGAALVIACAPAAVDFVLTQTFRGVAAIAGML